MGIPQWPTARAVKVEQKRKKAQTIGLLLINLSEVTILRVHSKQVPDQQPG